MSTWDGSERRKGNSFCSQHLDWAENMAVIKQAVIDIKDSIKDGNSFRRGVVVAIGGIILTIMIQVGTFTFLYGGLYKQVEINTQRWDRLLENNPVIIQNERT